MVCSSTQFLGLWILGSTPETHNCFLLFRQLQEVYMKTVSFLSLYPWHWTYIFPPQQLHEGYITCLLNWSSISRLIKFYHWQILTGDLWVDESERHTGKCDTARKKDLNGPRHRHLSWLCNTSGFPKEHQRQWTCPLGARGWSGSFCTDVIMQSPVSLDNY